MDAAMVPAFLLCLTVVLACTFAIAARIEAAPLIEEAPLIEDLTHEEQVGQHLMTARSLLDRLEAVACELATLESAVSEAEVEEWEMLIYSNPCWEEYERTKLRIMRTYL